MKTCVYVYERKFKDMGLGNGKGQYGVKVTRVHCQVYSVHWLNKVHSHMINVTTMVQ